MSTAAVEFDPYRTWLNISVSKQPPGPYELLGLAPLETSLSRIQLAYERQRETLRRVEGQAEPVLMQRLYRELEVAYAILVQPERKSLLDASLRRNANSHSPRKEASAAAVATAPDVVICRTCQRENPSGRRFCGGCGQELWEKCARCGAECTAEERFCGVCGADVQQTLRDMQQDCDSRIEKALTQAAAHQYEPAFTALR